MTRIVCVDFHCHSSFSDGTLSPEQVATELACSGVSHAALTDHNTLAGWERFRLALEACGVHATPGVEMDVLAETAPGGTLHLLAYGFDPQDAALCRALQVLESPVWAPVRIWLGRLWPGRSCMGKGGPVGARDGLAGDGLPPFAGGQLPMADAIRLVHAAGGQALLAHPLEGLGSSRAVDAFLDWARPLGLDGIEAFYKPYPEEDRLALAEIATHHGLLASAGSDFHGSPMGLAEPGIGMPEPQWRLFATALGLSPQ